MVMDQFVTTQRADYVWPYVLTIGVKPNNQLEGFHGAADQNKELCPCYCTEAPYLREERRVLAPPIVTEQAWSRLGPMGPLLDPKVYPARVGNAPEFETSRYNQPNVFLSKLQEKYPYMYEILKQASPADMLSRINKDRLRTTYQVDFCNMAEYPNAPYDELVRSAGLSGTESCKLPEKLPGDPCRALAKDTSYRRGPSLTQAKSSALGGRGKSSAFAGGKTGGGNIGENAGGKSGGGSGGKGGFGESQEKCEGGLGTISRSTEYRDTFSRLGDMIIADKIHYRRCLD